MVSKITTKKTPKPSRRRPKNSSSSPLKKSITAAPSVIASSIHRSLHSCRRRLIKIFAHLAILSPSNPHNHGFRRLNPVPFEKNPLPPPSSPSKRTIFLDLDQTLVHSKTDPPPENYDFTIYPIIDGHIIPFYVLKRPGVDELLKRAAESFEVIVFTAGLREYASLVIDRLDPSSKIISHRLYRDSCREMEGGNYVKDLSDLGRDLGRVVIVDDNPGSYVLQPENAVPVSPFVSNLGDRELRRVMEFFETAILFDDMRDAVKYYLSEDGGQKKI